MQVDFSTLIEVSIQFKDDIDAAADYIVQNVVPNIVQEPSHQNINEDLHIHGKFPSCSFNYLLVPSKMLGKTTFNVYYLLLIMLHATFL